MAEYINRKELESLISEHPRIFNTIYDFDIVRFLRERIKNVAVAPIKHGKWEYEDVDIVCSVCKGDGVMPWNKSTQHKFPYCPHCGAKMDGEYNG